MHGHLNVLSGQIHKAIGWVRTGDFRKDALRFFWITNPCASTQWPKSWNLGPFRQQITFFDECERQQFVLFTARSERTAAFSLIAPAGFSLVYPVCWRKEKLTCWAKFLRCFSRRCFFTKDPTFNLANFNGFQCNFNSISTHWRPLHSIWFNAKINAEVSVHFTRDCRTGLNRRESWIRGIHTMAHCCLFGCGDMAGFLEFTFRSGADGFWWFT